MFLKPFEIAFICQFMLSTLSGNGKEFNFEEKVFFSTIFSILLSVFAKLFSVLFWEKRFEFLGLYLKLNFSSEIENKTIASINPIKNGISVQKKIKYRTPKSVCPK